MAGVIYPNPLGEALANQRRYLKQTYTLAAACLILLVAAVLTFWRFPDISGHDHWVGIAVVVMLGISFGINVANIIRTRRFLRLYRQ